MSLSDKLKGVVDPMARPRVPVWRGPETDGITFSLLSRFLVCRERFRLLVVEGLRPAETFNHRIEYGQMWHVCEEALASGQEVATPNGLGVKSYWEVTLRAYVSDLCRKYPLQQEQVDHWYNVCRTQFPLYVDYWSKHADVTARTPLLQEQVFDVPYALPSGRTVRLRGKWDSVDLIGKGKAAGIYLQENKTKGEINEGQIKRQLTFDLQTMLYLVAMENLPDNWDGWTEKIVGSRTSFLGVRYNVIRRPLSGGRGSIVRHKPTKSNPRGESKAEFYQRLAGIIKDSPSDYFMRWKVEVSPSDVARFRRECLDPILENLCYWWETITGFRGYGAKGTESMGIYPPANWRHPFGVRNVLDEGGSSDMDSYLESGSEVGLTRVDNLFPELT